MVDTEWERKSAAHGAGAALPCDKCRLPYARVQNGVLLVESRHHGAVHVNVITLQDLIKLLEQSTAVPAPVVVK